jgi:hypothetical protein
MSVIELIREAAAKRESQFRYAAAHDKFAELEQRYSAVALDESEVAHEYALLVLRAYRAEIDDPVPAGLGDGNEPRDGQWR